MVSAPQTAYNGNEGWMLPTGTMEGRAKFFNRAEGTPSFHFTLFNFHFHPIAFSAPREMPFISMWKKMLPQMELVRS